MPRQTMADEDVVASTRNMSETSDLPVAEKERRSLAASSGALGEIINYKTLTWWQGGIVLIAETVSLGILSLPSVVATLGLVPGILIIIIMSILSTYSGWVLGEFRKQYPHVLNFGDALEEIGRPIGMDRVFQVIFGWAQVLFQIFVMGSHILTWNICLNTLTDSSVCTIVWAFVGLAVFALCNMPRTLKHTSWMSMASCISITSAVIVTAIAVVVGSRNGNYSATAGVLVENFRALPFAPAFLAVTNVAVAFSSHSCFFSVIEEFKNPEDWPKALALLQIADTCLYIFAAVIIYYYVGPEVPSPALSAAPTVLLRKVIWGIAIPTIVIAGVIYGHVAAKYIFVRMFRNSAHMERRTKRSNIAWVLIVVGIWSIAMVIAESIPVFNGLLGLVAALFVSWFSYGLPGILWLWMNKGLWFSGPKQTAKFAANVVLLITGAMICVLGLWASGDSIKSEKLQRPWACQAA